MKNLPRVLVLLASLLCIAARAGAQTAPQPERTAEAIALVQVAACEPARFDVDAFLRLLELELTELSLRLVRMPDTEPAANEALATAVAVIAIECGPDPDALALRVSDLASGKRLERELRIADVGIDARPRALALTAATLLETSLTELAVPSPDTAPAPALPPAVQAALRARLQRRLSPTPPAPPAPAPTPAPAPAPASAPAPPPTPSHLFDASTAMRAFPGRSTGLIGLHFDVSPALTPALPLRLPLSAEALYGESDLADAMGKIGTAHLFWIAGGAGLGFVVKGTPELELGPRVLAGYALADVTIERMGAEGNDEGHFALAVLADATLRWDVNAGIQALLGVDLGYAPVGVVFLGDQARLSGMADTSFALRLGLGLR